MKLTPIDSKKEIEGSEMFYMGIKLIIARANNVKFKRMFRETLKPHKRDFDKGILSEEIAEDLMTGCIAKTILVGWEDLVDKDGKEWPYTVKNAEALLSEDRDVYDAITEFSEDIDNYITKSEDDTKGKFSA